MTVHRRPSESRKKYRPPATGTPKTAVVLLIRSGKVLTVLSRYHAGKNQWEEPGAKINPGESVRAAAARGLRNETGLDLSQCTYVGECYSPWPKAQVLVYTESGWFSLISAVTVTPSLIIVPPVLVWYSSTTGSRGSHSHTEKQ